jgi:hypothetical protein
MPEEPCSIGFPFVPEETLTVRKPTIDGKQGGPLPVAWSFRGASSSSPLSSCDRGPLGHAGTGREMNRRDIPASLHRTVSSYLLPRGVLNERHPERSYQERRKALRMRTDRRVGGARVASGLPPACRRCPGDAHSERQSPQPCRAIRPDGTHLYLVRRGDLKCGESR